MAESFTVAAVQAAYVLMDRESTTSKVEELIASAAAAGAKLIVFPEVFVPGTPIWIDSVPIWDGDEAWFARLVDQAVVVPSPTTDRIGAAARAAGVYVVLGVDERDSKADAHRLGADGVGNGRRFNAESRAHRARTDRRPHLLGELHAAGPVPSLCAGC